MKSLFNKQTLSTLLFGLFFSVAFFSCTKEIRVDQKQNTDNDANPVTTQSALTAIIGGDTFRSTVASAVINDTSIVIIGNNASGEIKLTVLDTLTGIYNIDTSIAAARYLNSNPTTEYLANSKTSYGQIRIESIDKVNKIVRGKFSFTGKATNGSTKTITDGTFTVNYTRKDNTTSANDTVYSNNPNKPNNYMRAVFNTDTVIFSIKESFFYLGNLNLVGYKTVKNKYGIVITIDPNSQPGNYALSGNFGTNSAYYVDSVQTKYNAMAGSSITILLNDPVGRHIKADFNLLTEAPNAVPPKSQEITDGVLEFYY